MLVAKHSDFEIATTSELPRLTLKVIVSWIHKTLIIYLADVIKLKAVYNINIHKVKSDIYKPRNFINPCGVNNSIKSHGYDTKRSLCIFAVSDAASNSRNQRARGMCIIMYPITITKRVFSCVYNSLYTIYIIYNY